MHRAPQCGLETTLSPVWTLLFGQEVENRVKLTHFIRTATFFLGTEMCALEVKKKIGKFKMDLC